MATKDLDIDRLREMFEYDPETGILRWRVRPLHHFKNLHGQRIFNTRYSGKATGYEFQDRGYLVTNIGGTPRLVHQLAWAVYHGRFADIIDHINLIGTDNRLINLRECTMSQNQYNRTRNKNNTSGYKGVCWHSQQQKWRAYIVLNYKQKSLGLYDTPEEAHEAFKRAADEMHGAFANYG